MAAAMAGRRAIKTDLTETISSKLQKGLEEGTGMAVMNGVFGLLLRIVI